MRGDRLFTFGCSFTQYHWPTWADICGQSFHFYENWGACGAGNFYIQSKVFECHKTHTFTPDDTVLVMFSSIPRHDVYKEGRGWDIRGNILTAMENMTPEEYLYYTTHWNLTQAYHQTWVAVQSVKYFLDYIGCRYKLMTAFDIFPSHPTEYERILPMRSTQFEPHYMETMLSILPDVSVMRWLNNFPDERYRFTNGNIDGHPTIRQHELWCKEFLSDYYVNPVDVDALEAQICWDSIDCNYRKSYTGIKQNNVGGILC